jgi:cobalamin synthase
MHALLALPVLEAVSLFTICAAASSHSLVSAHIGRQIYHSSSQFVSFGSKLKRRAFFLSSLVCAVLSFLLIAVHAPFGFSALTAGAILIFSTALGLLLRLLLRKTIVQYNGDVIGFVLLVAETLTFLFIIVTLSCKGGAIWS